MGLTVRRVRYWRGFYSFLGAPHTCNCAEDMRASKQLSWTDAQTWNGQSRRGQLVALSVPVLTRTDSKTHFEPAGEVAGVVETEVKSEVGDVAKIIGTLENFGRRGEPS